MAAVNLRRHGDAIFCLELSNPAKRNALTSEMWQSLITHLNNLSQENCRAIILCGKGDDFCSGADVANLGTIKGDSSAADLTAEGLHLVRHIRVPTIAAIRGSCIGGGLALAMACDFQIADTTARLGIPAARLGLVFSVRQTRILVAQVGVANTRRLLFLAETLKADAAHAMGLVSEICMGSVHDRAIEMARTLVENAPLALGGSKKIILDAIDAITDRHVEPSLEEFVQVAKNSEDHAQAKRAFSEKRKPVFVGR
jgi:enoyl-CoA hydratase/carnithine racemase